uniref:Uncharacterized protein n=1 Tax=Ananas comosus var. bracteatus TaxID=296719 RepID=A0A6V7Q1R0_ANACO|nr:unnamed protein product [Ananas comosus var. bracteatus]
MVQLSLSRSTSVGDGDYYSDRSNKGLLLRSIDRIKRWRIRIRRIRRIRLVRRRRIRSGGGTDRPSYSWRWITYSSSSSSASSPISSSKCGLSMDFGVKFDDDDVVFAVADDDDDDDEEEKP